jgi:2-amino-4-hydroxy-6-hydroxymethyldihydropteridine diphosphokinase
MSPDPCWVAAWVALGSNLDEPQAQVRRALDALATLPRTRLHSQSALYRSAPMGPSDQPDYVNAVAGLRTQLPAADLLARLQALERAAGRRREREQKWGPRPLDLDLLTYGAQRIDRPGLRVPHPGIRERNFVLLPLLSVAPSLEIPGLGTVRQLASAVDHEGIVKLG